MANKLVIAAVVALVAVDAVLVVAAVDHVSAKPPTGKDAISAATSAASSTTEPFQPSESLTPSQTPQSEQPSEPTRSPSLLSIGTDGTILRATSGDCRTDKTGEVEVSTDGGASFRTVYADVPQVLRVVAVSRSDLWFVGTDEFCAPSVERSVDTGSSWSHSQGTAGAYHLSAADDASLLHAPDGTVSAGCATVGIAPLVTDVAFVGCEDGTIRRTDDGGQTFDPVGQVDGLVALTFRDTETGFALASGSDCAAAALTTSDAGQTWELGQCLDGTTPRAIAANANRVVAQVSGQVLVSDDDGQSWAPAS